MSKFRKKPVVIEAHQWDGTVGSADAIAAWAGVEDCDPKKDQLGRISRDRVEQIGQFAPLTVHSLEGDMTAQPNDWVIRGVKGEFYPCKPDIFEATYEPAD